MRRVRVWRDLPDPVRIHFDATWRHLNRALKVAIDQQLSEHAFRPESEYVEFLSDSLAKVHRLLDEFEEVNR